MQKKKLHKKKLPKNAKKCQNNSKQNQKGFQKVYKKYIQI